MSHSNKGKRASVEASEDDDRLSQAKDVQKLTDAQIRTLVGGTGLTFSINSELGASPTFVQFTNLKLINK